MTRTSRLIDGGGPEAYIVAAGLQLSEVETDRGYTMLHGKAAPYDEVAYRFGYKEVWASGLFDESIAGLSAKLPLLIFHDDMMWPLGSHQEWESRPGDGLYGTWSLDRGPEAQRAAQMAADGHLGYLSVGYGPTLSRAEFDGADETDYDIADADSWPTITRLKARLMETSVVPVPLYHSAQILLVACAGGKAKRQRSGGGHAATPKLDRWLEWRSSISR